MPAGAIVSSPFVAPSITWKRLSLVNWESESGAWTAPITSIAPDLSALLRLVASLKYFSVTAFMAGLEPQ